MAQGGGESKICHFRGDFIIEWFLRSFHRFMKAFDTADHNTLIDKLRTNLEPLLFKIYVNDLCNVP